MFHCSFSARQRGNERAVPHDDAAELFLSGVSNIPISGACPAVVALRKNAHFPRSGKDDVREGNVLPRVHRCVHAVVRINQHKDERFEAAFARRIVLNEESDFALAWLNAVQAGERTAYSVGISCPFPSRCPCIVAMW